MKTAELLEDLASMKKSVEDMPLGTEMDRLQAYFEANSGPWTIMRMKSATGNPKPNAKRIVFVSKEYGRPPKGMSASKHWKLIATPMTQTIKKKAKEFGFTVSTDMDMENNIKVTFMGRDRPAAS